MASRITKKRSATNIHAVHLLPEDCGNKIPFLSGIKKQGLIFRCNHFAFNTLIPTQQTYRRSGRIKRHPLILTCKCMNSPVISEVTRHLCPPGKHHPHGYLYILVSGCKINAKAAKKGFPCGSNIFALQLIPTRNAPATSVPPIYSAMPFIHSDELITSD
jgi:hypothetical protein